MTSGAQGWGTGKILQTTLGLWRVTSDTALFTLPVEVTWLESDCWVNSFPVCCGPITIQLLRRRQSWSQFVVGSDCGVLQPIIWLWTRRPPKGDICVRHILHKRTQYKNWFDFNLVPLHGLLANTCVYKYIYSKFMNHSFFFIKFKK